MGLLKKILIALIALALLLIFATPPLLGLLLPEAELRARVLPRASSTLGRSIECDAIDLRLGWRGPSLNLTGLRIGPPRDGAQGETLELPHFTADLALLPLLRKQVELVRLRLREPRIELLIPDSDSKQRGRRTPARSWAAPAALAFAAPEVRLSNCRLTLRRAGGMTLECQFSDLEFNSSMEGLSGTTLKLRGKAPHFSLTRHSGDSLTGSVDLTAEVELRDEILRLSDAALRLESWELAPGDEVKHRKLSGSAIEMNLEGAASLAKGRLDLTRSQWEGDVRALDIALAPLAADSSLVVLELGALAAELGYSGDEGGPLGTLTIDGLRLDGPKIEMRLPGLRDMPARENLPVSGWELSAAWLPEELAGLIVAAPDIIINDTQVLLEQTGVRSLQLSVPTTQITGAAVLRESLELDAKARIGSARMDWNEHLHFGSRGEFDLSLRLAEGRLTMPDARLQLAPLELRGPRIGTAEGITVKGGGLILRAAGDLLTEILGTETPDWSTQALFTTIDLRSLVLEGPGLSNAVALREARIQGTPGDLRLENCEVQSGGSRMELDGRITGLRTPHVAMNLTSEAVDLADFRITTPPRQTDSAGNRGVLPPVFIPGAIDFRFGLLRTERLVMKGLGGRLLMHEDGALAVENAHAELLGGSANGELAFRHAPSGATSCEGHLDVDGMSARELLAALTTGGVGIEGAVAGNLDFRSELLADGRAHEKQLDAKLTLRQGALVELVVIDALYESVGLVSPKRLPLADLELNLALRGEKIIAERLILPLAEGGKLQASGSIGLDGDLEYQGSWSLGGALIAGLDPEAALAQHIKAGDSPTVDFRLEGKARAPRLTLSDSSLANAVRDSAIASAKGD